MWEPELESLSEETHRDLTSFLHAVGTGRRSDWVRGHFGEDYPLNLSDAEVIDDIYSKVSDDKGRSIYQCPKCARLYVQKQLFTNEWDCFEKAK